MVLGTAVLFCWCFVIYLAYPKHFYNIFQKCKLQLFVRFYQPTLNGCTCYWSLGFNFADYVQLLTCFIFGVTNEESSHIEHFIILPSKRQRLDTKVGRNIKGNLYYAQLGRPHNHITKPKTNFNVNLQFLFCKSLPQLSWGSEMLITWWTNGWVLICFC